MLNNPQWVKISKKCNFLPTYSIGIFFLILAQLFRKYLILAEVADTELAAAETHGKILRQIKRTFT